MKVCKRKWEGMMIMGGSETKNDRTGRTINRITDGISVREFVKREESWTVK